MADRRMFSRRIIESARFLRMPVSAQALYFHLGMQADDDGVVEGYKVLRMIGANEDDLRVLAAKGFAIILNEDLVTYLVDWIENNRLRPDRKSNSVYRDLLIQKVPDVVLIESKERADRPREVTVQSVDSNGTDMGRPTAVPGRTMDGIGKDRIGKVSIVQDSTGEGRGVEGSINTSAPEPAAPSPEAFALPLKDGSLYSITENDVEIFQQLYPGIDVRQEMRGMVGWCTANPSRRKTKNGAKRFINGWLTRSQEKAGKPAAAKASRVDVLKEWMDDG